MRLGLGSFELDKPDANSVQNVRADFFRVLDNLEGDAALTLYQRAFFQFVLLAWSRFPETIPSAISEWLRDRSFLSELERVIGDSTASPYNPEANSLHTAFIELLAPTFSRDKGLVLNYPRAILMTELLRPFENLRGALATAFPDWKALEQIKPAAQLRQIVLKWSQDWNLDEDWCRDYALAGLCDWLSDRGIRWGIMSSLSFGRAIAEVRIENFWAQRTETFFLPDGGIAEFRRLIAQVATISRFEFVRKNISFQTSHWNPLLSYRDDWARRSEDEFRAYLARFRQAGNPVPTGVLTRFRAVRDEYLDKIEKAAPQVGLIKTPRRWATKHLTWTVRFQVQRWSLAKIEKADSKPRNTINDGIKRTLDFIHLKRRPDLPHGMPKGTRLSTNRRIVRN